MSPDADATITHAGGPPAVDPTATVARESTAVAAPPAVVPGYRLERELGRGGMGVVYLATQDGLNRQVALKMVLSGEHASATDKGRFLAEAEAVAAVRHAGVVQVFDFGTHDGRPYFALEYLSGGSLADRLQGTPLPAGEAAKLVEAVARAVQAAHDAGIIHRDLKPGNILFDADGTPKVTDFGLARKGDSQSGLTATGAILGTPSYMAPEQAQGLKEVGPPADVYALGAVLYECLTGRPPFRAASPLETIQQVLGDEPVPPSRFTPKLPRDLETVALKCLSKDPRKRYPSAGAMAADLNRYLSGEPILARPVSAVERGWRWLRKNPLLATVVVGGPVLLTGTVLVVLIALLLTAVANVRLAAERQNAENRRVEAEQEREKAHARLEKAVEAVDKMLNRVGEERWATNPALQEERRQVLEDAVAFFNSFTAEDSTDPLVRKEAAKAHARVAAAYLMLGDLPKVAASAREATRLYDGLAAEFPDEPEHLAAASEVSSMVAGANSLNGEVGEALTAYTRALELADAARGKDRASAAFKLRAVQARATLGFFYLQGDRAKGEALLDPMLALAREIGTPADAKYEHRAALAFALAVAAAYDLSSPGRPSMVTARGRYDEAKAILDDLAEQPPPTARAREYFAHTRAMVATNRGLVAALLSPTADGRRPAVEQMRAGLGEYDALLRVNPKALPYRLQKYHTLRALAGLYQGLGQPAEAGKANEEAGALMDAMLADHSHLDSLRLLDATRQAYLLVRRLRGGDPFAFEPEAEKLLVLATANNKPTVVYDVACVYAVASEKRPADAERYAAKAMALLTDLAKTDYFRTPAKVAHVSGDADLKALAERDDFKAFLERVKNAPADPPKPK